MSGQEAATRDARPRPGVPAAEALEGLPVANPHRLEGARVTAVTATTLRAALDLLLGESVPRRPLEVTWDDGALEVRCPVIQPEALSLAGGLMETIEGSLSQSGEGRSHWVLRVPVHGPHAMYLMLQQGTLALAVPWHSVLRVRMLQSRSVAELALRDGSAVLPPFVSVPGKPEPRPAVLMGIGLKRAYLVADRLIWRMPAERVEEKQPASGLAIGHAVRTLDGEIYWAVEAAELLAKVEPVPLPKEFSPPSPPDPPPPPPPLQFEPVRPPRAQEEERPPRSLTPDEVEPLGRPQPEAAPTPQPVSESRRPLLALIAEDSFIGRIFLQRLLERRGFVVESVGTARELEAALARSSWDVVMADVELPDAAQADHLRRLADPVRWVALVRDREDERLASEAGVSHHLRKPFESDHLDHLLPQLGFGDRIS